MMAELNYIILTINGIDVSQLPQNEAVKMFLTASESIVLEVRRKCDIFVQKNITSNATDVDIGVQESFDSKLQHLKISPSANKQATTKCSQTNVTTIMTAAEMKTSTEAYTLENELKLTLTPSTASVDKIDKTETSSSTQMGLSKSTQTHDSIFLSLQHQNARDTADRLIEQEHHLFEQSLAPEIDIEEITLRKSDSDERLGLIVCYSGACSYNGSGNNNGALSGSDDNETCTEVYISDIHLDSVAGRDGRLRQGDQILQINGKDIKNKEETESLMAENNNAVTLLVSRYLCADEYDFNDPSVADIDVEDDGDEDDEEYYDDSNLAYENCFMANDYINVVDELDKVLLSEVAAQQENSEETIRKSSILNTSLTTVLNTATSAPPLPAVVAIATSSAKSKCIASATTTTTNETSTKNSATRDVEQNSSYSVNGELSVKPVYTNKNDQPATSTQAVVSASTAATTTIQSGDYETEHIYETIPEDCESEPFYCSPYESTFYMTAVGSCSPGATDVLQLQQQKQHVAQWLGLKSNTSAATTSMTTATTAPRQSMRSSSGCGRSLTHYDASNFLAHNRNVTLRSVITTATNGSSISGGGCIDSVVGSTNNTEIFQNDEQDNSSSAYNTGGSNNSVTPLILVLNQNNRSDRLTCSLDNEQMMAAASRAIKSQRFLSPKHNITSPKNNSFSLGRNGNGGQPNRGNSDLQATETLVRTTTTPLDVSQQQLASPKTMYTNEANLYQTMLLQQHIFRKAITQQQNQHHLQQEQQQVHCAQFTAPNLSQYHFVSSQEVSAAHVHTIPTAATTASTTVVVAHTNSNEETAMVWKVKRRPDGTRYIVRRPARNRLLRDRSVRLNTERVRNNEITTTEEDTVSEVKTGRYWSKEERKKHIERASERRQQHQHNASGPRTFMSTTTMRISDRTALKLQQQQQRERTLQRDQKQQHQYLQQQQQQQQIMSKQHSNTRPPRQGSLKASQHHQLQFNSVTTQQQQQQFSISTPNVSVACTNISSDIKSKQLSLPCKNVSSYTHTICSPVDVLPPRPITTAVASPGGGAVIANLMMTSDTISYDTVPIITTQNFQTINNSSKIKDLLSVTTV